MLTKRYHIDVYGKPVVCPAQVRCRVRGGDSEHFVGSRKQARVWAQEQNAKEHGGVFSQGTTKKYSAKDFGSGVLSDNIEVAEEKIYDESTHYQHLWVKDKNGKNAVFAKINRKVWSPGHVYVDGVVICDLEVNPANKGKGAAVDMLRLMKKQYGVDVIYTTGSFSHDGYRFFQRTQAHEQETGERLLAIAPGHPLTVSEPRKDSVYAFVNDWNDQRSMFKI